MESVFDEEEWDLELLDSIILQAEAENKARKLGKSSQMECIERQNHKKSNLSSSYSDGVGRNLAISFQESPRNFVECRSSPEPSGFFKDLTAYVLHNGSPKAAFQPEPIHGQPLFVSDSKLSYESHTNSTNNTKATIGKNSDSHMFHSRNSLLHQDQVQEPGSGSTIISDLLFSRSN